MGEILGEISWEVHGDLMGSNEDFMGINRDCLGR
jgi:hypothetical protein